MKKKIKIINAHENNLKNIFVEIPKWRICGICGASGSGKSTLASKVIAQYALNAFSLSMPVKLRKKISMWRNPKVEKIENLSPVILVDIKNANRSIRSTVATTSGLMTILRNMFSFAGNLQEDNTKRKVYPRLFSYNIQMAEGGGACPNCGGTGKADLIKAESIIKNNKKPIFLDAFYIVNDKGIKYTKITDIFIKAACIQNGIDVDKPISSFTDAEMDFLLYGSDRVVKFIDRTGANGGKKELPFPGIIGALLEVYKKTKNANIEKYITNGLCCSCKGTRYNDVALKYKVDNYSISDFLSMSVSDAQKYISSLPVTLGHDYDGYAEEFSEIACELIKIGVGYLTLDRAIATLSGGELQRIKIAKQISMNLKNNCYVIDEPSSGLHDSNIVDLIKSIKRLRDNHNTVLIVEHNPLILNACDYLIELGVGGGSQGGEIVAVGQPDVLINKSTLTGKTLKRSNGDVCEKSISLSGKKVGIYGVDVNNLDSVDLEIPLDSFVTIAGVSGSGKSSAVKALFNAVSDYISTGIKRDYFSTDKKISSIVRLDQNASVTNSRSTVATLLGILDIIRKMYSDLDLSKKLGFDKPAFSKNNKKGSCALCGGLGLILDMDQNEEICDECDGTGYKREILHIKYKGYSIADLLALTIDEVIDFMDDAYVIKVLTVCQQIGLGYLSLDRKSPSLSKGEYQRIRLAAEICKSDTKGTIYVLDEPSKGLHFADANKIIKALRQIVCEGNTVIAIEHNLDVIMSSDYIIEFGPGAGSEGGRIVYCGDTEGLKNAKTKTAEAIKGYKIPPTQIDNRNDLDIIEVRNSSVDFDLKKKCINILRGPIGSGKSILLRNTLFSNPLKRYVASISNQGKYLTRDIIAEKNNGPALPLSRLISDDIMVFGKHERVAETLNLTSAIEILFFDYGKNNKEVPRSSFNFSKKSGKCVSCGGNGRYQSYDFDLIMNNRQLENDVYSLINERTRISRIAPLLKSEYGIDISKKYSEMSDEEKQIFLYGDHNKVVYYAPKKKEYWWDGCNSILITNMSYASELLKDYCKSSFEIRNCKYCKGLGVNNIVKNLKYKGLSYEYFCNTPILELNQVFKQLINEPNREENHLLNVFDKIISFGMGDIKLCDYVAELEVAKRMMIQYISYRINPLSDTLLAWDDFGMINDPLTRNNVLQDFKEAINDGTSVLLVDNNLHVEDMNEIIIGNFNEVNEDKEIKFKNILFTNDNKLKTCNFVNHFSFREVVGNYIGILATIRDEYKKKYKKYNFTGIKDSEKCDKCNGKGFYMVNSGDIGITKCVCPDCQGTGFSAGINQSLINGESYGHIMDMPFENLYNWCIQSDLKQIAGILELYVNVGLGRISLGERIQDLSSNEKIIFAIANLLKQSDTEIVIKDFSTNIAQNEYNLILEKLDKEATKLNKRIIIVMR